VLCDSFLKAFWRSLIEVEGMSDYVRGVWESLNYAIMYLETNSKEAAIQEFNILKNKID